VCGKWALRENRPFTFNVIGSDLNLFLKRNNSRLGNQWLTNLKGVVCNSEALKKDLQNLIGDLPNVRTIYRGVDTDVFSSEGEKAGPQASLQPVRFLYLGGFHTWDPNEGTHNLKGGHTLLEAWRMVENQVPSASIVIGGPGVYQEQFRSWQATLTNPQHAFCINSIDPVHVASYIRSSDVVIIPSLNEGLPNIAKEALACGRPILGTNVGGIPEVVENGKTGLIIPPDNPGALAAGIKWFYGNQGQIKIMGNNGRNQMKEFFSWEQYKDNMIEFFGSAISKNPQVH
jgi:glycosyltransferase involved in cell wall biosynthesis